MKVAGHAVRILHPRRQVAGLRLQLLHADKIGVMAGQPVKKTLLVGRTDAVEVGGNDSKHGVSRGILAGNFSGTSKC
ncbi:hypothetical protein D3C85_1723830 [compost metagenome]